MEDQDYRNNKPLNIVVALVLIFCIFELGWAFYNAQTTGLIHITSSSAGTIITVSQQDHEVANVGTGKATIRLRAGTYQIIATTTNNAQVIKTIHVNNKGTVVVQLQPTNTNIPVITAQGEAQSGQNIVAANELIQLLPFTGPASEYKITYSYSFTNALATPKIIITAPTTQAQQDATAWIRTVGFDPSTLDIQYITGQP